MVAAPTSDNANTLEKELDWFAKVLNGRLKHYFNGGGKPLNLRAIRPPELSKAKSGYGEFINRHGLGFEERLVIVLSLVPHIRPQMLDGLFLKNDQLDRGFTEFGGILGKGHNGFLPTGETALFLLAGDNLKQRLKCQTLFDPSHFLLAERILTLRKTTPSEPAGSGELCLSPEYLGLFTTGKADPPEFGEDFPAKQLTTRETWGDLVLRPEVMERVHEIQAWIRHRHTLMKKLGYERRLKPGFKCLFHGPPGTGKTMTVALLANETGHEVYRVDLALVVSKWVGETSKQLAKMFDRGDAKDWILFFDEADALFGKRTQQKDAHDLYANQEIAYLLQRLEEYNGVVILATNLRENLDDAFSRRFNSVTYFPLPGPEERLRIWQNSIEGHIGLDDTVDLTQIAAEYDLSGGAIMNVIRYAVLMALENGAEWLTMTNLEKGIRNEMLKEGRSLAL